MEDQLILVDEKDRRVGVGEKLWSHQNGVLHRAFSTFIFNSQGELLLQRRALGKYHSAGLWSNTCCGHPRPGEWIVASAQRRLKWELNLDCRLRTMGSFIYKANVGEDLIEHEVDHLLIGYSNLEPTLNPQEAIDWRRVQLQVLASEVSNRPQDFTRWLQLIMETQLHQFDPYR
jgi:isopentenyl-diphosphate Delta-isomerase